LKSRGLDVTAVRVYEWGLPEDTAPLHEAVRRLADGKIDVALFTTSIQVDHLFRIAVKEQLETQVRAAFKKIIVASIGPTTSEELAEYGIRPALEPSHPKMGLLVNETAQKVQELLSAGR
jgi:uroporphyrinogen-III synthase